MIKSFKSNLKTFFFKEALMEHLIGIYITFMGILMGVQIILSVL
jgi:hypothetical protein